MIKRILTFIVSQPSHRGCEYKFWKLFKTILIANIFVLLILSQTAVFAANIYVPDNYSSIQAAVDAANPGDTIIVKDGTYVEYVNINKSITIKSENGAERTIVQARKQWDAYKKHVFEISADHVKLSGFKINGRYYGDAVACSGIRLDRAKHCNISHNIIYDIRTGIFLLDSSDNFLDKNTIFSKSNEAGIALHHSSNNTLTNNIISSNYYWGICLTDSSDNVISNNVVSDNGNGIGFYNSSNNLLSNNTVINNESGILLELSNDNTLTGNIVSNNNILYGIFFRRSSGNKIYLNSFINNKYNAFYLLWGLTNTWNSSEQITYTYNGKTYTNYLGNYWSDYVGNDGNNDGIGDTPYSVDGDQDSYPLMKPYLYVTEEEVEAIPATATALVIDHSGSMGSEKKLQKAQEAARCYIDSISEEEWASIAAFSSSGHTVVELLPIKTGRERLKQGVFSLSAATNTNIGAGLEVGLNQLFSAKKEPKEPIILLLSDGMHNTGELWPWVEECKRKQVKVYTVAFGSDADQVTLCKIAHQTGGRCFPAGIKNLSHIYHKANIYVHNNSTLFASSDWLKPGQELKYKVDVPSDFRNLTFFTNWQGSSIQTVVVKPDGSLIYPSLQMGDYQKGNTYSIFKVPAETGIWELKLSGQDLPQEGEQINVSISGKSETYSNFLTFQPEYKQGQRVLIRVEVADVAGNQKIPLENIKIKAKIEGPTPQLLKKVGKGKFEINPFTFLIGLFLKQQEIDLYDDGAHDDYDSRDGIYGGTFLGGDIPGPYLVTAIIEGQSQGKIISRQIQESFQIGSIQNNKLTISDFIQIKFK